MSTTVADRLLERLREWGVEQVFGYPGDGINGLLGAFSRADDQPRFIQARHEEMAAFEAVGLRQVQRPGRRLHGDLRARARSTCSTACTTPSSTTSRWSRSSARPTGPRWAAATSRRSTCSACSRTSPATTCRW